MAEPTQIILGIDPGIANCGYGMIRRLTSQKLEALEWGTIKTPAYVPTLDRLGHIYQTLGDLVKAHQCTDLAMESVFFAKNVRSALPIAEVCGMVKLLAFQAKLTFASYTPLQVKQATVTYGRATKDQMLQMVVRMLNLSAIPTSDHAGDALAVALCHAYMGPYSKKLEARISKMRS